MAKMTEAVVDNAKKMGDEAYKAGRNVWLAYLGAVALADEETRGLFGRLVDRGEKFEKSDRNLFGKTFDRAGDEVKKFGGKVEDTVQNGVGTVLNRAGVPSRNEIRMLIERVETLNQKVDGLNAH